MDVTKVLFALIILTSALTAVLYFKFGKTEVQKIIPKKQTIFVGE